ncbi:Ran GTPase-activating protein 1 [Nymphon striatum]|nr:Ran GTPase-activating protein 1 [Nymphon striatum]
MDIEALTKKMAGTNVDESGKLSFEGLGLRLDNEEQAKEIIDKINNFKNLCVLELAGNTVGVGAAKGIAKALEGQPSLKRALWKDMFTGRLKQEIPEALVSMPSFFPRFLGSGLMLASAQLVELDLSDNAFGPIGVEGLLPLLRSCSCYTLEELKLNNNGLGVTGGKALASSLLECHKSSSQTGKPLALKKFVCGRNRLEDPGATALAEVFKAIGTLEEISMPQNGITHLGVTALANAFSLNDNLTKINLNDNTFTEVGSIAMAKVLTSMNNLKSIDFGDCLMRTGGAEAVAKSLANDHIQLEELCMSYNEILKEGGLEIVSALKNKSKLRSLDINGNQFGEEGVRLIKDQLEKIGKIATLTSDEFSADESEGSGGEDEFGDEDDDDEDDDYDDIDDSEEDEEELSDTKHSKYLSPLLRNMDSALPAKEVSTIDDSEEDEQSDTIPSKHLSPLLRNKDSALPANKDSVTDFLDSPNLKKLDGLGEEALQKILKKLESFPSKNYIDAFIKISELVTSKDVNYHQLKMYTDGIMKKLCKLSEESSISVFTNLILSQFGLIKNEDKFYKMPDNMVGPFLLLAYSVDQKYFPMATKRNLKFFLTSDRNAYCMQYGGNEVLNILDKHGIK